MSTSATLTRKHISNGVYEGVFKSTKNDASAPDLELNYLGNAVGETWAEQLDIQENTWLIRCTIPADTISDGIQTFLICNAGGDTALDSFSIVTGEPLDDDLRNEISLLREELDMLKRAFRRHCVETMG
jgi:hypothetical protein